MVAGEFTRCWGCALKHSAPVPGLGEHYHRHSAAATAACGPLLHTPQRGVRGTAMTMPRGAPDSAPRRGWRLNSSPAARMHNCCRQGRPRQHLVHAACGIRRRSQPGLLAASCVFRQPHRGMDLDSDAGAEAPKQPHDVDDVKARRGLKETHPAMLGRGRWHARSHALCVC